MKKTVALLLALALCLGLCACGEKNGSDDQTGESTEKMGVSTDGDGFYSNQGMSHLEVELYYQEEWIIEGSGAVLGLPTKLDFNSDGTCVATYPASEANQTMNLYWGYVPDGNMFHDLYVRIGTQEEILYLFRLHQNNAPIEGFIAPHSFVSAGGTSVDGLAEDGYETMWVSATGSGPEDSEKDDSEKDDSEKDDSEKDDSEKDDSEKNEQTADNYEKIELTVENWDTYFELAEEHRFSQNVFGENDRLHINHFYRLKEGYEVVGEETTIAIEYTFHREDRENCHIDFQAGTYTLGACVDYATGRDMTNYFGFINGSYTGYLAQGVSNGEDQIIYYTHFQLIRVKGTLCLKKN